MATSAPGTCCALAKQNCDLALASGRLEPARAQAALRQLAACEGSDAFWWAGSDSPHATAAQVSRVFKGHLSHLYRLLELPVPSQVDLHQ
jgi:hypothetical protein